MIYLFLLGMLDIFLDTFRFIQILHGRSNRIYNNVICKIRYWSKITFSKIYNIFRANTCVPAIWDESNYGMSTSSS